MMATDIATVNALWNLAAVEAADDSLHRKRMQGLLEAALAAAMKRLVEGKITMQEWEQLEKAITSIESALPLTTATIAKLAAAPTIDPAKVTNAAQRLEAVADAMLQTVASLSPTPTSNA